MKSWLSKTLRKMRDITPLDIVVVTACMFVAFGVFGTTLLGFATYIAAVCAYGFFPAFYAALRRSQSTQ